MKILLMLLPLVSIICVFIFNRIYESEHIKILNRLEKVDKNLYSEVVRYGKPNIEYIKHFLKEKTGAN